jgi:hypothetical protein
MAGLHKSVTRYVSRKTTAPGLNYRGKGKANGDIGHTIFDGVRLFDGWWLLFYWGRVVEFDVHLIFLCIAMFDKQKRDCCLINRCSSE